MTGVGRPRDRLGYDELFRGKFIKVFVHCIVMVHPKLCYLLMTLWSYGVCTCTPDSLKLAFPTSRNYRVDQKWGGFSLRAGTFFLGKNGKRDPGRVKGGMRNLNSFRMSKVLFMYSPFLLIVHCERIPRASNLT